MSHPLHRSPGTPFTVDRSEVATVRSVLLTGQDVYDALTAYVLIEFALEPRVQGAIFPRELPPPPEPATAE